MLPGLYVPTGHENNEHGPDDPGGTYNPELVHCTQAVDELESVSEYPAEQLYAEQRPVDPAGAYVPALHDIQGVDALLSISEVPAEHLLQTPNEPAGA